MSIKLIANFSVSKKTKCEFCNLYLSNGTDLNIEIENSDRGHVVCSCINARDDPLNEAESRTAA